MWEPGTMFIGMLRLPCQCWFAVACCCVWQFEGCVCWFPCKICAGSNVCRVLPWNVAVLRGINPISPYQKSLRREWQLLRFCERRRKMFMEWLGEDIPEYSGWRIRAVDLTGFSVGVRVLWFVCVYMKKEYRQDAREWTAGKVNAARKRLTMMNNKRWLHTDSQLSAAEVVVLNQWQKLSLKLHFPGEGGTHLAFHGERGVQSSFSEDVIKSSPQHF